MCTPTVVLLGSTLEHTEVSTFLGTSENQAWEKLYRSTGRNRSSRFIYLRTTAPAPVGLLNVSELVVEPPENGSSCGLLIDVSSLYIFQPNTKTKEPWVFLIPGLPVECVQEEGC